MNIEELIERGETQSVEFKESLRLKDEIGETVSAFSNSDGGAVLIGVSNSGVVSGVDIGKTNQRILSGEMRKLAKESGERVYWDERVCEEASLIHRNYHEPADTRVMIFDDRIGIVNPGSFPEGVTPENQEPEYEISDVETEQGIEICF